MWGKQGLTPGSEDPQRQFAHRCWRRKMGLVVWDGGRPPTGFLGAFSRLRMLRQAGPKWTTSPRSSCPQTARPNSARSQPLGHPAMVGIGWDPSHTAGPPVLQTGKLLGWENRVEQRQEVKVEISENPYKNENKPSVFLTGVSP